MSVSLHQVRYSKFTAVTYSYGSSLLALYRNVSGNNKHRDAFDHGTGSVEATDAQSNPLCLDEGLGR